MSWFSFLGVGQPAASGIEQIFPLACPLDRFIRSDLLATYLKILTDVAERTHGLSEDERKLLWDSCVQSDGGEGLLTMLSTAMLDKTDLFLVYVPSVKVLRRATDDEERQIRVDYKALGTSTVGVFVSFKNYRLTDMLLVYSALEYCVLSSLHKTVNISKAVQVKMSDMRASVSLGDSQVVIDQARSIAEALRKGQDILLDAKDVVTTATPDVTPTEKTIAFLDAKRAYYLTLPLAYITGLQSGGIGSTGEGDTKAVERGLRLYFVSIMQPVVQAVFGKPVEFRSQDFRQIESALDVLKTFDLVSDLYLSAETKRTVAARMFDVDPEEEALIIEAEAKAAAALKPVVAPPPAPALPPPAAGQ